MLRYGYLQVFQSHFDFEIMRVDCKSIFLKSQSSDLLLSPNKFANYQNTLHKVNCDKQNKEGMNKEKAIITFAKKKEKKKDKNGFLDIHYKVTLRTESVIRVYPTETQFAKKTNLLSILKF